MKVEEAARGDHFHKGVRCAPYRIDTIRDKVDSIAEVCRKGGGVPGRLSFDVARMAVNDAGSLLTNALSVLGQ